jgi:4-hydroxybenzoate polyprenyltransferase
MNRIFAHMVLMRPANIITAIADILAGFAAAGAVRLIQQEAGSAYGSLYHPLSSDLAWLALATVGLYGGGVVFNDVFDAELDQIERPERPIPSGAASKTSAALLGALLLLGGIGAAFIVSATSGIIATVVAGLALLYDAWGKHQGFLGPLNMGACRGGNLLLGMSAVVSSLENYWYLALIPIVYIANITVISRGEVHGGSRAILRLAVALYVLVFLSIGALTLLPHFSILTALPFGLLFAYLIFPPLLRALKTLQPKEIRLAVKAGVLSLIIMDATLAAGFAGWLYGLAVLLLFPISRFLAKRFAVT